MSESRPRHVLTVDVEDWEQLVERRFLGRLGPPSQRAVSNTHAVLDLLARHGLHGTFFVLGLMAESFPGLVKEIAAAGHEVGTHGYSHRLLYDLGPTQFRAELRRSIHLIADITGQPVVSHRAAEFSLTPRSSWAWQILAEEGIRYDSSVFPIAHPRYGWPGAPTTPYPAPVAGHPLWEWPLPSLRFGRWTLPVGGGGYLRLWPYLVTRQALRSLVAGGRPAVLYLHPYELDPLRLRIREHPKPACLHAFELLQNVGRGSPVRRRLDCLLREFRPGPLYEVAASWPGQTSAAG